MKTTPTLNDIKSFLEQQQDRQFTGRLTLELIFDNGTIISSTVKGAKQRKIRSRGVARSPVLGRSK